MSDNDLALERTPSQSSLLLTVEEAAFLLRLGRTTTYGLVLGGEIQSVKIGRRRLVTRSGLEAFVARCVEGAQV